MAYAPNLGLGSRQWRDYFSSTVGWSNVSLAPSRTRRTFDPIAKPTQPTIVHLAPGEYTGPLHISAPYPVIIRPSQLGEASKVVIRCPEPDRTSRRVKYVAGGNNNNNSSSSADLATTASAAEELPLEPAMIISNGAQVFVEGLHFHGRVEVLDGASVEFLDCTVRLAPHVASATAQIAAGAKEQQQQQLPPPSAPLATSGKGGHAIYRTSSSIIDNKKSSSQRDVVVGVGSASRSTDVLCRELSAVSVTAANMWASNCVFDVLAPNGVGLLASSYVSPAAAAMGNFEAEDDYRTQQQNRANAGKPTATGGNINVTACVLRRASYGFVFYGDAGFAPRVENNKISGCSAAGIVCAGAARGSFRGNHVGHCDKFGVVLEGSCAPWLHMNIIEENGICGVVVRDTASPTLVRNTLLANGTVQLFCADVASVRAQNSHFSGESVNGAAPSAAGLSSFAARSILEAPKGDIYAVCATDNCNLLLDNCVIECADSCVISATGATVKCTNCTLQPEAADKKAASDAVAENELSVNSNRDGAAAAAAAGEENNGDAIFLEEEEDDKQKSSGGDKNKSSSYPAHRAFVKSDFATLTTDGSVVAGVQRIEVRALEDFPDVDAVITEVPKYLFESIASAAAAAAAQEDHNNDGGEQLSPSRPVSSFSHRRHTPPPPPGVMRNDAAIRMSLSFTPRRPLSATSGGGDSFRRHSRAAGGASALAASGGGGGGNSSSGSFYTSAGGGAGERPTSASAGRRTVSRPSTAGGGGNTTSAQRLGRFDPPQQKTDWHELKDKKQIYSLKVEVSRLRKQLYSNNNNQPASSSSRSATPRNADGTTSPNQHNQSGSKSRGRIIGGGDMEEGSTHKLGYHRWNNSKMKDFYHGKATLAEVRSEEKPIPGTDVSLGERLHDRWLRHKIDEQHHVEEEEQHRAQEGKSHALSREAQQELGRRLHDEVMERFKKDRERILLEEKDRYKVHAPFMNKNAQRRGKSSGGGVDDGEHQGGGSHLSANEEEELRCQRISERLKEQHEARERMQKKLLQKYHLEPMDNAQPDKKLSRKQVEAYCASLHKSHRDEGLAAAALDTVNLEFAQKSKARDEAMRAELLGGRGSSPKRSREQIEAYSDSLYKGHKDIGAHNRAKEMLNE